jgi:hypothetical protein
MSVATKERVQIENVLRPGSRMRVDREKYEAVRRAFLAVLAPSAPGLTAEEIRRGVLPRLSETLFPGGAKAGWWMKAVQLDLEAKGLVVREEARPLRWHRA